MVCDRLLPVEPRAQVGVVLGAETAHRDPQRDSEHGQAWKHVEDELVDPRVGEADRVQHAGVGLGDADGRVPLARERRHRLRHEGVELSRDLRRRKGVEAAGGVENHATALSDLSWSGPDMSPSGMSGV